MLSLASTSRYLAALDRSCTQFDLKPSVRLSALEKPQMSVLSTNTARLEENCKGKNYEKNIVSGLQL